MAKQPRTGSESLLVVLCCTFLLALAAPATTAASAHAPASATTAASGHAPAPDQAPAPAPTPTEWKVEYIMWAPDCQKQRMMIGINGVFPGPNITARVGETIRIKVHNKLHTEGLVIHWHGMLQMDTPWADGTASISQCAINPGESFTYEFVADKPGTFFYHGHYGMQRSAGLYGWLIVNDTDDQKHEPYRKKYGGGGELLMLLSDWYHENVYAQAAGLERKETRFQWVGEPQTILINGRGQHGCILGTVDGDAKTIFKDAKTCDMALAGDECKPEDTCNGEKCKPEDKCNGDKCKPEDKCDAKKCSAEMFRRSECGPYTSQSHCYPVVFDVKPGTTYRLRIASTTSLSALNVQVQGHNLTVVEADGHPVKPFNVTNIDVYSGESYSVLLTTNDTSTVLMPGSFWISVGVRGREPKTLPATAVLRYTISESPWPTSSPPETPKWDDLPRSKEFTYKIKALKDATKALPPWRPKKLERTIWMLNTQTLVDGHLRWAINNVSLVLPPTPYLGAYFYGVESTAFDATGKAPDQLPDGYDIGKPPDKENNNYVVELSNRVYELPHGALVDVVLQNAGMRTVKDSETHPWHLHGHDFWVLGYGEGKYTDADADVKLNLVNPPLRNTVVVFPHGWTVIRFIADNVGAWALHCHIEPHLHMGMGAVFIVGAEKIRDLKVPKETMMCGEIRTIAAELLTPAKPLSPAPAPAPAP